jgi:putative glutamine amidotransferase
MSARFVVACAKPEKVAFYADALRAVGVAGDEILGVYPDHDASRDQLALAIANAAGFVLCGGEDVDPCRYGETEIAEAKVEVDPIRDAFEWQLLDAARAARTPTLGVCRGCQVLNVYLGGTLYQDLPLQRPSDVEHSILEPRDALAHTLVLTGTNHPLASVLAVDELWVNSRHHQAVKQLAPGLVPFASAPDGVVEGYFAAAARNWWAAGVQWHPENLVAMPVHREFWTTFVKECSS